MTFKPSFQIRSILENLPSKPGVYLFKNEHGKILYIGKAKRLRDRVRSYFGNASEIEQKTRRLRARVRDIQFIVVENEVKALILEETLIKRHLPTFNVLLKDDKRYPYIRVNWQEPFPKVENYSSHHPRRKSLLWSLHSDVAGTKYLTRFASCFSIPNL